MVRSIRVSRGVTLVELLVALAVSSILMVGVIAAFQTVQRTAAIGEARRHIYQNGRVALDLMSKEIKSAYIDNRNRDLVFISADGLAGRGSSILEFSPNPPAAAPYTITYRGLGNAQTPHGIDPTGTFVFGLYADESFGSPTYTRLSVKAIDDIYSLAPGPPDRLDFTCMTSNFPGNTASQSRLAEVRYCVTTETFVDDADNDYDGFADEADNDPPNAGLAGLGDMIFPVPLGTDDLHPEGGKIKALKLFHLRRGIGNDLDLSNPIPIVDKNPFSAYDYPIDIDPSAAIDLDPDDPFGRYPARNLDDFEVGNSGENIGSYIYDLQLEFRGRIALSLDSNGAPNTWGIGWGYQDVRGEDTGLIDSGFDGAGPASIEDGSAHNESAPADGKTIYGVGTSWASLDEIDSGGAIQVNLAGGVFFVLPEGADEFTKFDTADPDNEVYRIESVVSNTEIRLDRPYVGLTILSSNSRPYRIIEPNQANGILDKSTSDTYPEDLGTDGLVDDPLDDGATPPATGIPNNVSDNDGVTAESSIGEGNGRLDSRVMGIWDSRSPDPRNPRMAAELNGWDDDTDFLILSNNSADDDQDGQVDDRLANYFDKDGNSQVNPNPAQFTDYATPESDDPNTNPDDSNDLIDDDNGDLTPGDDNIADDRFYEPAGRPEGVDEPGEADPDDDSLPKAVRITIVVRDPAQSLDPVVLGTVVWLSTAE